MEKNLKVLFDEVAFNQPFGGVAKYFCELIRHLPTDIRPILPLRTTQCVYLQESPFDFPKATHTFWNFMPWLKIRGKSHLYRWLATAFPTMPSSEYENRRVFRQKLVEGSFDILHLTGSHWYDGAWKKIYGKKPIVITVHDLIPDIIYNQRKTRCNRAEMLEHADHVIAVSQWTKDEIVRTYGTDPLKITVVHHGHEDADATIGKNPFWGVRYILYVGTRRGYKNFKLFAPVAARILKERPDLHLVCTHGALTSDEMAPFLEKCVGERVHATFVQQRDLYHLYANATLFVYPSKHEGFGMPIVDAFAAGCPTLLARASCFPEVGGDAAQYFDPDDEGDLYAKANAILSDSNLRTRMITAGRERAKRFSWAENANKTAGIYRQVSEKYL